MKWQGSIDFQKAIKLDGKPHGIEHVTTLSVWTDGDQGRIIHSEDDDKLWFGGTSAWLELTPGGVGVHDHDDIYYTETEIDGFFEGENGGKKQVDFINVINKPSLYNPVTHSNTSHSETYLVAADVTFETLQTNGDVGTGTTQLAIGSHNHNTVYAEINHNHDDVYYTKTNLQTETEAQVNYLNLINVPTEFTPESHTHLETDLTIDKYTQLEIDGFLNNKSDINHNHDDVYYTKTNIQTSGESLIHWDNLISIPSTFTPSAHNHDDLYYTETELGSTVDTSSGADKIGATVVGDGSAQTVQGVLEELNTAISTPITKTLYVDINRIDTYIENGSFKKPFKTIQSATDVSTSGDTIIVMAGTYIEDIVFPAGVSVTSYSLNKVSIQGDVTFNGPGVPITIHGMIFTGTNKTLTIDCTANIIESYSYSKVVFGTNAHITTHVFNVNVNEDNADAITFNGTGTLNMIAATITSKGDSYAIKLNSGKLALVACELNSASLTKATLHADGGSAILISTQVINSSGSTSIDLSNSDAIVSNPNALSSIISVGSITCGTKYTITNGIEFIVVPGTLSGTALTYRPSTQISYDDTTTSLGEENIQGAIDKIYDITNNPKIPSTSGLPVDTPESGTIKFDASTNILYIYNGSSWVSTTLS